MPDEQPSSASTAKAATTEWVVLDLLLGGDEQRPWSVEELVREIGRPVDVADAIANLHAAGLIHRTTDGFVFATRAAVRFHQIAG
jgi:predicted transcriptional regulator